MISPQRGVRSLLLLIAFGMVVIGALQVGLEYVQHHVKGLELDPKTCAVWIALAVAGVILTAASGSLARRITGDDEDDEDDDGDLPPPGEEER